MQFSIRQIHDFKTLATDCLVLAVPENSKRLQGALAAVNTLSGHMIRHVIDSGDFSGKAGQHTTLYLPKPSKIARLLLIGCGKAGETDLQQWARSAGQCLQRLKARDAVVCTDGLALDDAVSAARQLTHAIVAAQYHYSRTLSHKPAKPTLRKVGLHGLDNNKATRHALQAGQSIAEGTHLARELGNLPGNICTPSYLASEARKLAKQHKSLQCQVLNESQMRKLGMGALLSVSRGSDEPACLITLQYKGGKAGQKPIALIGKGITFDSGGISLKPGAKMDEMKYDMCGAASVLGTLHAAAAMKLPLNIVGIVAASENMPNGRATKPGDIITSMSGKTIEVLNTDAEGRLVLCDALTYVGRYKPDVVIDIATLTGACVVALGEHASGLFSNDDALADDLLQAGTQSGDRAWRMPLWDDYQKQLKSPFADMANIGGPGAGSVTAACFLARFAEDYTWAHLDIAGTAWKSAPKNATGRPVGLLSQYLINRAGV
ncbi:MAG TPA: leucyl aminopeptidase [Pseudomonadales bacterium]